jgi:hypothetical protein
MVAAYDMRGSSIGEKSSTGETPSVAILEVQSGLLGRLLGRSFSLRSAVAVPEDNDWGTEFAAVPV